MTAMNRLVWLTKDALLDLDQIESICIRTDSRNYARNVHVRTRSGGTLVVTVPHTAGGDRPANEGDRTARRWVVEHLGVRLHPDDERHDL